MRIDTDHVNNGHQNNLDDNKCVEKARKKVAAIADRAILEKETEDGDYNVGPSSFTISKSYIFLNTSFDPANSNRHIAIEQPKDGWHSVNLIVLYPWMTIYHLLAIDHHGQTKMLLLHGMLWAYIYQDELKHN